MGPITTEQLNAVFFDIQPDADVTIKHALTDPESFFWSFKLSDGWYTCREWSEVLELLETE